MQNAALDLAARFRQAAPDFVTSPLYRALCMAVADDEWVLGLLNGRRSGQDPPFLLFGAVHYLLLSGAEHPLRCYYSSVSKDASAPDGETRALFSDFCRCYVAELRSLISSKLVQTNVVNRAIALRYALWAVGRRSREPLHLIDVGTSAGTHLCFDRYRHEIGGRVFGDAGSSVRLVSEWRSAKPVPDLNDMPPIISRTGIDLNPIDAGDPEQRLWLRALVWPEDQAKAAVLTSALVTFAQNPSTILGGDVASVIPTVIDRIEDGEPVVVFHAAVRMHLTASASETFDAAIDSLAARGPLFHAWLEPESAPHDGFSTAQRGGLQMHGPDDKEPAVLAAADGHLAWIQPA